MWLFECLCQKQKYYRALEKAQSPDPSVPRRGRVTSVLKWRLVGVTASRPKPEAGLPISKQRSPSGDACGGDDGGRRHSDPGLGREEPLCTVECTRPCARPTKCTRLPDLCEMTTKCSINCQEGPVAPSSSFGGRGKAHMCTTHTAEVWFLKA